MHETRKNDELDFLCDEKFADFFEAGFAFASIHINEVKRQIRTLSDSAAVFAIADDGSDFDGKLAEFRAPDDFVEAVIGFCHQNSRTHFIGKVAEMPFCIEGVSEWRKVRFENFNVNIEFRGIDLKACKKFLPDLIGKLAELNQVAVIGRNVRSDFCHDSWLVGRGEFEDESGTHRGGLNFKS